MSMLITQPARPPQAIRLPEPRVPIAIRPGTMPDVAFMDSLQKVHNKQVGYFPTKQFEGYVEMGGVLVAEDEGGQGLGYIISRDRYLKRDELGVIFQLCVVPSQRRKLVAAALLREVFARSAYGCRLYCCWCAQDLAANHFWESMGFVPIAFRGGSATKRRGGGGGRVHIFWQKRIREGDVTTPWWFPAKTDGGALREDRLVLPIPPHLRWSDEMPVLQVTDQRSEVRDQSEAQSGLTSGRALVPGMKCGPQTPTPRPRARVQFGPPGSQPRDSAPQAPPASATLTIGTQKPKREKRKCDPKLIATARELRDRFLEQVNANPSLLLPAAKYDIARVLPPAPQSTPSPQFIEVKALPQAA